MSKLIDALHLAKITFAEYAALHLAKDPPDTVKAERNQILSQTMEEALQDTALNSNLLESAGFLLYNLHNNMVALASDEYPREERDKYEQWVKRKDEFLSNNRPTPLYAQSELIRVIELAEGDHIADVGKMVAPDGVTVQKEVLQTIISVLEIAADWNAPTYYDVITPDVLSDCVDADSHEPTWLALYPFIRKLKAMLSAAPTAQPEKVDVEKLKREVFIASKYAAANKMLGEGNLTIAGVISEAIDHLANTGRIKGV